MAKWATPKRKRTKNFGAAMAVERKTSARVSAIEQGLKTRIVALLMLILASSLGLWFADFQAGALILWLLIAFAGGYAVFEFDLFVSKVFVVVAAIVMEFLVLDGVPDLVLLGSAGNMMLLAFGVLDAVLIYTLAKL